MLLLCSENIHLSIPIVHCIHMKETYDNMDLLLKAIRYSEYERKLSGDPKVIGTLLRMQSGYTKFCCFLCEWEGRAKDKHYKTKDWPMRGNSFPGEKCVRNQTLFDKDTIFLQTLHINLVLRESFVKVMNKRGKGFEYLKDNFPKLSDAKLKEDIFIEPQIREIINGHLSEHLLTETEKPTWLSFKEV